MPHTENQTDLHVECIVCDWDADHQPPELMRMAGRQHRASTGHQLKVTTTTVEVLA